MRRTVIALSAALLAACIGGCVSLGAARTGSTPPVAPSDVIGFGPREAAAAGVEGDEAVERTSAETAAAGSSEEGSEAGGFGSSGAVSERVRVERRDAFNPYLITAHRHNYFLPFVWTSDLNDEVYESEASGLSVREGLRPVEVEFQISLKSQLNGRELWLADDAVYFGITIDARWQLYATDLSSPFRETSYQPEIYYLAPLPWRALGGSTVFAVGLEHQSNGQVQGLSRSWNRLYATFLYERGNFVMGVRPWYRLPEREKRSPDDPDGDDNPDILDFTGHGELSFAWRDTRFEYALRLRGNPATDKGAATLGLTFPLFGRFRGFVRYFNGYGDSLIDYDHFQTRIGAGIALTNLF